MKKTRDVISGEVFEELSGYNDLGMRVKALRIVDAIFSMPLINPQDFDEAMRSLGMFESRKSRLELWKGRINEAYSRQPVKIQRGLNSGMMAFYYKLAEYEKAAAFITKEVKRHPFDAIFVMSLLLRMNRMEEAKLYAAKIKRWLKRGEDRFTYSSLITVLATYYERVRDWKRAVNLWEGMPLEEPFRRNALCGVVEIHLARALDAANGGIQKLDRLEMTSYEETGLMLPGNEAALTREARANLVGLRRKIEKILPEHRRRSLGLLDGGFVG